MRRLRIPRDTSWFASGDWGSNNPGVLHGWFDVGDGHWHIGIELKFQHESVESVCRRWHTLVDLHGITKKCSGLVLDPACWTNEGDSIAMMFTRDKMSPIKAINDRKNGWVRLRELLRPAPDGVPWLTIDAVRCPYLARTLPSQRSHPTDADDVDTHGDDHGADSARYGALSGFVTRRTRAALSATPYGAESIGALRDKLLAVGRAVRTFGTVG